MISSVRVKTTLLTVVWCFVKADVAYLPVEFAEACRQMLDYFEITHLLFVAAHIVAYLLLRAGLVRHPNHTDIEEKHKHVKARFQVISASLENHLYRVL